MNRAVVSGVPRPVLVLAIALTLLLAAGVAAVGVVTSLAGRRAEDAAVAAQQARRGGPLAVPPAPAPQAGTSECAAVLAALPAELSVGGDRVPHRALASPAPPATVAWGDARHDPVTLRCGVPRPAELTPTSQLEDVSGVEWLPISQPGRNQTPASTTWISADRPVFVVFTVPNDAGTAPLQDLSAILRRTLPRQDAFGH